MRGGEGEVPALLGGAVAADDDRGVDLAVDQGGEVGPLGFRVAVGVDQQRLQMGGAQQLRQLRHRVGVVCVGDHGVDDADGLALVGVQAVREGVGNIALPRGGTAKRRPHRV